MPIEEQLGKEYDASVITVREALKKLHDYGYITKKQGSGNYIHQSAKKLKMRMDINKNAADLLRDEYGNVQSRHSSYEVRTAEPYETAQLGLDEGELGLSYETEYLVNQKETAVFVKNFIPLRHTNIDLDVMIVIKKESILDFYEANSSQIPVQTAVQILPENTGAKEATLFGIPEQQAMIRWEEVFYNMEDEPIGYSSVLFNPRLVRMSLILKWI